MAEEKTNENVISKIAKSNTLRSIDRARRISSSRAIRKFSKVTRPAAKQTAFKQRKLKNLVAVLGMAGGQRPGAGRPRGSGKYQRTYGMGVNEYRRFLAQRRALAQEYVEQKRERYIRKGYNPEQVEQIVRSQPIEQPQNPTAHIDEELSYKKFMSERALTPNTQRILERLRRVQLKGRRDDMDMQRRLRERRVVSNAGNLMKAHENMNPSRFDITGVSEDNILKAPNTFKENPENNILRPRNINVLTPIQGNNIMERKPDSISLIRSPFEKRVGRVLW